MGREAPPCWGQWAGRLVHWLAGPFLRTGKDGEASSASADANTVPTSPFPLQEGRKNEVLLSKVKAKAS